MQLFMGGVMPVLTWRGLLVAYITFTAIIVLGCLMQSARPCSSAGI